MCKFSRSCRFALLVLSLMIAAHSYSQSKTVIGLNLTGEHASSSTYNFLGSRNVIGLGVTFERKFTKHSGFETGLFYRTFNLGSEVYINYSLYDAYTIKQEYASVPTLYKFYSYIVNASVGPTFEFYTGWRQKGGKVAFNDNPHPEDSKFNVGILGKVSKTIGVTKHFLVEPEIRYSRVFYQERFYYGAGVAVKCML
jgi:hypothetical protein